MPESHQQVHVLMEGYQGKILRGVSFKNAYTQKELWYFMDAIPNDFYMHAMDPMATLCEFTIAKPNPVYARYCQSIWTR